MKKLITAFFALAALGSSPVFAAASSDLGTIPTPLKLATQGGLHIDRKFPAEGGLTGWVVSAGPTNSMVVFTTGDGKVAIAGALIDSTGENLTQKYLKEYAPKVTYNKFTAQLEKSFYAEQSPPGAVKSTIYIFVDPNCPYCHMTYRALLPYVKEGLRIRWIIAPVLGGDGPNKAAEILSAKNPVLAFEKNESSFGQKGPQSTFKVTPEMQKKLSYNTTLLSEMGFGGVPAILYVSAKGELAAISGAPDPTKLDEIAGFKLKP
jgi:thiol:disulfide interchange protein DsbG